MFEEFFEVYFSSTIVGISISRHIATTPTVTDGIVMAITVILLAVVCEGCVAVLVVCIAVLVVVLLGVLALMGLYNEI